MIRTIMKKGRMEPSSPLFKKLNLLKLEDVNNINVVKLIYKSINGLLSCPVNFVAHQAVPYNLRRIEPLAVPFVTSRQSQRFIRHKGAQLWNHLPQEIREARTFTTFKSKLKKHYISLYT